MATINVDSEKMQKMATFVASAAPQLEKLASLQASLDESAPKWVDSLIAQGLLKKEARLNAINDLKNNGINLEKIGEVIEYLIANVGPSTMGSATEKRASYSVEKGKRPSDAEWERALLA